MDATDQRTAHVIVVGATIAEAARLADPAISHVFLTTHEELLSGEVSLDEVDALYLGDGPDFERSLEFLRMRVAAGNLKLWVDVAGDGRPESLREILREREGFKVVEWQRRYGLSFVAVITDTAQKAQDFRVLDEVSASHLAELRAAVQPESTRNPRPRERTRQTQPPRTPASSSAPKSTPQRPVARTRPINSLKFGALTLGAAGVGVVVAVIILRLLADPHNVRGDLLLFLLCYLVLTQIALALIAILPNRRILGALNARALKGRPAVPAASRKALRQLQASNQQLAAAVSNLDAQLTHISDEVMALAASISRSTTRNRETIEDIAEAVVDGRRTLERDIAAHFDLLSLVQPQSLTAASGMDPSPELARHLVERVRATQPGLVVVLEGMTASITAALALRRFHPEGRVLALVSSSAKQETLEQLAAQHDVAELISTSVLAPEVEGNVIFDARSAIDLLVVDDDNAEASSATRQQALDLVTPRLSDPAAIIVKATIADFAFAQGWALDLGYNAEADDDGGVIVLTR